MYYSKRTTWCDDERSVEEMASDRQRPDRYRRKSGQDSLQFFFKFSVEPCGGEKEID